MSYLERIFDGDELDTFENVDVKFKWFSKTSARGEYFFIDKEDIKTDVYLTSDLTVDEFKKICDKNLHYESVSQKFIVQKDYKPAQDYIELLPGIYEHIQPSTSTVEMLTRCDIRKDGYIERCQKSIQDLKEYIDTFLASKEIYKETANTLYKTAALLYGVPGNGKTSLIRNYIRNYAPKDSYVIFLNNGIPTRGFLKALDQLNGLKIFVVEEITTHNKTPSAVRKFLTMLDGEDSLENTIVIATTNYPQELEENLTDRPGRFDLVLEIKNPNKEEAHVLLENFLKRELSDDEKKIDFSVCSVAHLQYLCLRHKITKKPLDELIKSVKVNKDAVKKGFSKTSKMGI